MKTTIKLRVNKENVVAEVDAKKTLLAFLRDDLQLTGTKEGCNAGECGACTVIMNGKAVNSCMVLAAEADGCDITTIEGEAVNGELSGLQKSFIEYNGFQCGFCTPGMIMSARALLNKNPDPSIEEIKEHMSGNLCRCTGYETIIAAVQAAAKEVAANE